MTATAIAPEIKHPERRLGEQAHIDPTARVRESTLGAWTAVGPRTTMAETVFGDYSYVVNDCSIIYSDIGKFCSIAAHGRINPGNHPMWRPALHHFSYRSKSYELGDADDASFFQWRRDHKVVMGNDVWIGHGVVVLPGVKIGTGAAIGAGAVVSKNIPPFAVAVGVPAKVIRFRFDEKTRERLLSLAWWDWTRDQLRAALPDFRELPMEEFLEKYEKL